MTDLVGLDADAAGRDAVVGPVEVVGRGLCREWEGLVEERRGELPELLRLQHLVRVRVRVMVRVRVRGSHLRVAQPVGELRKDARAGEWVGACMGESVGG